MGETKELLLKVKRQVMYVSTLEEELDRLRMEATQLKSPSFGEAVQSNHTKDLAEAVEKIDEYAALVKKEINRLNEIKRNADTLINQVPQEDRRAILRRRYFLCQSWMEVSRELHYHCDYLRRLHNKALDFLDEILEGKQVHRKKPIEM